jgi:DNA-directed RNA polymerase beta' subunit
MVATLGVAHVKGMAPQERVAVQNSSLLLHEMKGETYLAIQNAVPKEFVEKIRKAYTAEEREKIIENELSPKTIEELNRIIKKEMRENPDIPGVGVITASMVTSYIIGILLGGFLGRSRRK